MYRVVFSNPADRDILQIVEYIATDNPEAAKRFGAELLDLALSLKELPHRGSRVKKRPGHRKLILGDYLIYYRIGKKSRTVEILRFLHGAQIK